MEMTKCLRCEKEVAIDASVCPHCGENPKTYRLTRKDLPSILLCICLALAGFTSMLYVTQNAAHIDLWGVPFVTALAALGMLVLLCRTGTVEKWHVWVIVGVVCATIAGMLVVIHETDLHANPEFTLARLTRLTDFLGYCILVCGSTGVVMTALYLTRPITTPDYALLVIQIGACAGGMGYMFWLLDQPSKDWTLRAPGIQQTDILGASISAVVCMAIIALALVMARRNPPRIPGGMEAAPGAATPGAATPAQSKR